ncbi:uncharacterized protein [Haliotis asinina]|uniref:uncharacterized protein n=1 Tax=Haliotis asinina TaxID=109174 RepID=UPI00353253D2
MLQDSLDHGDVVKGPPEIGEDLTEQLRLLHLAREDDTADIQLQSDIDQSAIDLERLVMRQEALPRGKRDEVDGLIPRMMRHGGVIQRDGHVPLSPPPPYPGSHPYQRPAPQQRSSPPQSHQLRQHHQRQHHQQAVRDGQQCIPRPQFVSQDNFHLYSAAAQNVQQNLHPDRHAMSQGIQESRQTLPPPYPGGVPTETPLRLNATHKQQSETNTVNLDDVLSILKHDLETDGASIPLRSIPNMETTADMCGSMLKNGQSDWLQNTSKPSSGTAPVVPNIDDITSQMLHSGCSTLNTDHELLFQGEESGSLQYPHCSDRQFNQHAVIQNNSSAYTPIRPHPPSNLCAYQSSRPCVNINSSALVPCHMSNSSCRPFFEDNLALKPDLLVWSRTDSPDFRQQNTGFSKSRALFKPSKDRTSLLDHGTVVKTAGSSQQSFGFLPVQNGACCGGATVCHPKQERFSPEQNKSLSGETSVFKPPQETFSVNQDKTPCGGAPVFQGPPETFSPEQDQVPHRGAPFFLGPPERFSPEQDKTPCGGAPVFQGPPERVSCVQNNPPCGQDPVFPLCPDRLSPEQDGRCSNLREASGGSPCSSTSSHHSPHGSSPACSTEYSDDEDEDINHEENTVVHYFADLGVQQVTEIYTDNKQLVENKVNNLNHQRQTALYIAVTLRKYNIVHFLMQIGADPNIQCVESKSGTMQAPLHKAIELGDTQMVLLLLANEGLDIELQRVCDKKTPLMLALHGHIPGNEERDRREIIHHLLDYGACIDKFNESSDKTILMMAIETRDVCLVEHFLDSVGVERSRDLINRANKVRNTSLHIAAGMKMLDRADHLRLLTMLIHFGGNTDAANQDLKTPKDWKRNLFDEIKRQHLMYQSRY